MVYKIKNNNTNREYEVIANRNQSFDTVWFSQICFFSSGSNVTITNENGDSKTYIKE